MTALTHDFQRDSDGEIDLLAMDAGNHGGPRCERCGDAWCASCEPGRLEEPCPGVDLTTTVTVTVSWPGKGQQYADRRLIHRTIDIADGMYESLVPNVVTTACQDVIDQWARRDDPAAPPVST